MFTDSHCHLAVYGEQLNEVLEKAQENGVTQFIVPSQDLVWDTVLCLQHLPAIRTIGLGLHPWLATQWHDNVAHRLHDTLRRIPHAVVGEIGLDFLHSISRDTQMYVLLQQLMIAQEYQRWVILHNVKASAALINALDKTHFQYGGIVHAFSGSLEEAKLFIKRGFKIGLGVLLLNPRAKKVRQLAQYLPLDSIVLETDSPYMFPNNTPANTRVIAQIIADIRQIPLETLAQQCEQNLNMLFQS